MWKVVVVLLLVTLTQSAPNKCSDVIQMAATHKDVRKAPVLFTGRAEGIISSNVNVDKGIPTGEHLVVHVKRIIRDDASSTAKPGSFVIIRSLHRRSGRCALPLRIHRPAIFLVKPLDGHGPKAIYTGDNLPVFAMTAEPLALTIANLHLASKADHPVEGRKKGTPAYVITARKILFHISNAMNFTWPTICFSESRLAVDQLDSFIWMTNDSANLFEHHPKHYFVHL